jgi:hypothetical protein
MMLFAYITLVHSRFVRNAGPGPLGYSAEFWAAIAVMSLGILVVVMKSAVDDTARWVRRRGLVPINQWVLHFANHDDLTLQGLDRKAVAWFTCARTIVLYGFLAFLSLFGIPALGLIVLFVLLLIALISFYSAIYTKNNKGRSWWADTFLDRSNYSELMMVFGLIFGYMIIVSRQEEHVIASGVLVLAMARFSGEAGKLAWGISSLRRWHHFDAEVRQRRAKRLNDASTQTHQSPQQKPTA